MRYTRALLLALLVFLSISGIALAAYSAIIQLSNSSAKSYVMYPARTSFDTLAMVDNNIFNTDNGMDTRVISGATELYHLLSDNKLLFTTPLSAGASLPLSFTTGNSLLDYFHMIWGRGGYYTVADNASIEAGDNFTVSYSGYVDEPDLILYKDLALYLKRGTDNITLQTVNATQEEILAHDTGDDGGGNAYGNNWFAQSFFLPYDSVVSSLSLKFYDGAGNPGDAVVSIQMLDDEGKPDGTDLTSVTVNINGYAAAYHTYDIPNYYLASDNYSIVVRLTGGDAANYGTWRRDTTAPIYTNGIGLASVDGGDTWSYQTGYDYTFRVYGLGGVSITAYGVSSGERDIEAGRDDPFYGLAIDTDLDLPVTDDLQVNAPLWQNECSSSPFATIDDNELTATVTEAVWSSSGYTFDGVDDKITIPDNAVLDITNGLTLEAWVNVTTLGQFQGILGKAATTWSEASYALQITDTDVLNFITTSDGTAGTIDEFSVVGQLTAGDWIHIVATFDKPTKTIYLDGVYYDSASWNNDIYSGTAALYLGRYTGNSPALEGILGEVRIYDRALTPAEIAQNYNATKSKYTSGDIYIHSSITSVPNNTEDWVFMSNATPYAEYIKMWVGGNLAAWWQPNDIISGTTLPDRESGNTGTITWGHNDTGIAVNVGSLRPENPGGSSSNTTMLAPPNAMPIANMPELAPPSGPSGDLGTILDPLVGVVSEANTPVRMVWYFLATLIVLGAIGFTYKYIPNLWVAGGAGGVMVGACFAMSILPYWIIIAAAFAIVGAVILQLKGVL